MQNEHAVRMSKLKLSLKPKNKIMDTLAVMCKLAPCRLRWKQKWVTARGQSVGNGLSLTLCTNVARINIFHISNEVPISLQCSLLPTAPISLSFPLYFLLLTTYFLALKQKRHTMRQTHQPHTLHEPSWTPFTALLLLSCFFFFFVTLFRTTRAPLGPRKPYYFTQNSVFSSVLGTMCLQHFTCTDCDLTVSKDWIGINSVTRLSSYFRSFTFTYTCPFNIIFYASNDNGQGNELRGLGSWMAM